MLELSLLIEGKRVLVIKEFISKEKKEFIIKENFLYLLIRKRELLHYMVDINIKLF